jgi:hypothetical protein
MSKVVEEYYKQANMMPLILKQKLSKLQKNTDILQEFEYWIQHKDYKKDDCVSIDGYTAEKLAALSEYVDGEGAFMLLIELRENHDKALRRISNGFKMK